MKTPNSSWTPFHFVAALFCIFTLCTGYDIVNAEELKQVASVQTVAGVLQVVQLDEGRLGRSYAVILNEEVILKTGDGDDAEQKLSDFPVPIIVKHFRKLIPPFDEVILFQQNSWGNACNGGPLWFLGLKKDGSYHRSEVLDFCGGFAPMVKEKNGQITIVIPGGSRNRGQGHISSESWAFKNGRLRRTK